MVMKDTQLLLSYETISLGKKQVFCLEIGQPLVKE